MLQRLNLEGLEIDRNHLSVLDVYCSDVAKRILEGELRGRGNLFDRITQIAIGPSGVINPVLLPDFELIERNKFYGANGQYLSAEVLADIFNIVYMDAPIELPEPREGEEPLPKHFFLKSVYHSRQIGKEFQLEFRPQIALDLTQRLRDYLPGELLKNVTSYVKLPL